MPEFQYSAVALNQFQLSQATCLPNFRSPLRKVVVLVELGKSNHYTSLLSISSYLINTIYSIKQTVQYLIRVAPKITALVQTTAQLGREGRQDQRSMHFTHDLVLADGRLVVGAVVVQCLLDVVSQPQHPQRVSARREVLCAKSRLHPAARLRVLVRGFFKAQVVVLALLGRFVHENLPRVTRLYLFAIAALIVLFSRFGMLSSSIMSVFICSPIRFCRSSFCLKCFIFRFIVEFQWFLMALSVLPGKNLAMMAQRFPSLLRRSLHPVRLHYRDILFLRPPLFLDVRVQVVVPPLPALLPDPSWQFLCNERPVLRPVDADHLSDYLIFLFAPRSLHQSRVQNFLPPVKALHITTVPEELGDLFPVSSLGQPPRLPRTSSLGRSACRLPLASTSACWGIS